LIRLMGDFALVPEAIFGARRYHVLCAVMSRVSGL
jgi:hypothetical protein